MESGARCSRPRGRPREFDREAALDAAVEVFWRKGFEAASIHELTEAMGVNPPSLYAAFGGKEQLFLAAMERYDRARGDDCPYDGEPTARSAIAHLLDYTVRSFTARGHPRGCMMMMAAATSSNSSAALQEALARQRLASREHLRLRIARGIRDGDVPAGTDPGALADFYAAVLAGMSTLARDGASRESLGATAERALAVFP
jgi:AcrR family transcriptional regulator